MCVPTLTVTYLTYLILSLSLIHNLPILSNLIPLILTLPFIEIEWTKKGKENDTKHCICQ